MSSLYIISTRGGSDVNTSRSPKFVERFCARMERAGIAYEVEVY